jgi:DNA mismatch endonuclease (patch repair protein)
VAVGCTPDFVLPGPRLAVFVDGCFWHGCPQHSPKQFRGPNADRWADKLARNRARDARAVRLAEEAGWSVLRVWECEVRRDVAAAAERVRKAAG